MQEELRKEVYDYLYNNGFKLENKQKRELSTILKKIIEYKEKVIVIEKATCKKCTSRKPFFKPRPKIEKPPSFNSDFIKKEEPKRKMSFDD